MAAAPVAADGRVVASPFAKKIAAEKGIDLRVRHFCYSVCLCCTYTYEFLAIEGSCVKVHRGNSYSVSADVFNMDSSSGDM